ncbi:kinesin-like protein KIF20A [Parus major]|uniref:kinesin-like protein KIF20A n=1 Tax=Parus major TaxID=9157 RepID=UPI00077137D6|nr:kinesin-like protein KIF20A [Parus major]XP_015497172.1 kinesin-like protein KIF20A [Parus major]XP_015497173.1 kinesin-like protein KIF20A [Parus major]
MAQVLASPGLFSDDEAAASPVLESTATGFGADVRKDLLPEFSVISPNLEGSQAVAEDNNGKLKVFLRVRPLKSTEVEKGEDQGCVCIENSETLILKAPKNSFTMRSTERGVGQAVHRFSFTRIFGPEVGQKLFFDETMKQVIKDVLSGQNCLVYTYGITNSGKTHTIQGTTQDGGILPRSLATIFNSVGDRLYQAMDLKPVLSNEVSWLDSRQVRQEETKKQMMLQGGFWEEELLTPLKRSQSAESQLQATTSGSFDSGVAGLSSSSHLTNHSDLSQTEELGPCWADLDHISLTSTDVQFSIWVSFFEIYNELIYDLLEPALPGQNRKRQTLRLCEDQSGNPYVKDLNWINVRDADEAWKLLKLGRKNQSFASTHMNQNSSRSHCVFSIRILHLQRGGSDVVPKISELSLCDLAGSERCKDQKSGDRMKEANNINTSLHTLGRCIAALRQNQQARTKQAVVPFRDSKLTRVFQGFFSGRGRSCMIVNINQCASTYDETLHVAKFSAIASQLVQAPPTKLGLPSLQSIIKEHNRRISQGPEAEPEEDVESEDNTEDDEADVSMYEKKDLLRVVEAARELLVQERQKKLQLEVRLREEICNEMLEHMQQKEQWWSQHVDAQREQLEELYEGKMTILKELLTDHYQEKMQERDEEILELKAALQETKQKLESLDTKQKDMEQSARRSKRVAASSALQQELADTKARLEQCQKELNSTSAELRKYQKLVEPPPSAKPITMDVDRKLQDGQKNVRLLRSELQKIGESLQSAERACCHSTGAGKLREALGTCDDILARQDQTLAELQNNMMLVKLDLRKKAACIAEQYHTVQKLQAPTSTLKKRFCANRENLQPNQPPGKKPFLHNILTRSATRPAAARGWQLRSVAL